MKRRTFTGSCAAGARTSPVQVSGTGKPVENEYGPNGGILKMPEWYTQGKPKPPGGRTTFTTWKHFDKDSPLLASGLLGPVRLRTAVRQPIES